MSKQEESQLMNKKLKFFCWATSVLFAIYSMEQINNSYSLNEMQHIISLYYLPILVVYILIISLRGLLFIPTMPLILLMVSSIDGILMFVITLVSSCISAYLVCLAVNFIDFKKHIEKLPTRSIERAQNWIQSYGIIAIAGWAFFPFVFTELIVYLARFSGISKQQIMISVLLGEGLMLGILVYITDWFINLTN